MIAEKIKQVRIQKGYSQEKLAENASLNLRTIQRVENGKSKPRGDTLVRIAEALNVTIDEIIDLIIWISQKDKIEDLTLNAKELLSFQITWNLLLFLGFISYLIWLNYKVSTITVISPSIINSYYTPIWIIFGGLYLYNIIIVCYNIHLVSSGRKPWYKPRINFLS